MTNSIHKDIGGPDWPIGQIIVAAAGTPVNLMSNVDPTFANDPGLPTAAGAAEYSWGRCNQIIIQGFKGSAPMVANTGNLYLVRKGAGAGTGNRADQGSIVLIIPSGQTGVLGNSAMTKDTLNPYRYYLDADNAGDAGQVTLLIF